MLQTFREKDDDRTELCAIRTAKSMARLWVLQRQFALSVRLRPAPVTRLTTTIFHPPGERAMLPTMPRRAGGYEDGWLARERGARRAPTHDADIATTATSTCTTHQRYEPSKLDPWIGLATFFIFTI